MADKLFGFLEFVNESYNEEINEDRKWMQKAFSKNKGKLHKKMHIAKDDSIPLSKINKRISALKKKKNKTKAELTEERELVAARTAKRIANENFVNEDNYGDIIHGADQATVDKAERMVSDLFNSIRKKISLRSMISKGYHSLKNRIHRFSKHQEPESTPSETEITFHDTPSDPETGMVLHNNGTRAQKKDEIAFLDFIKQNLNTLKWSDIHAAKICLNLSEKNIEQNDSAEELQDLCAKINNLIIR